MKHRLVRLVDKGLICKQTWMESVQEPLNHVCPIEPTRHRRVPGVLVTLIVGFIAYCDPPPKSS